MSQSEKPKILFLDDDEANLISFEDNFRKDFTVLTSRDHNEALRIVQEHGIQVAITGQNMPKMSGIKFLENLSTKYPEVQRVLLTGEINSLAMIEAVNRGKVCNIITKPFNLKEIQTMIHAAFENFRKRIEKDNLIKKLTKKNEQFEFMLRQQLLS